MPHPGRNASLPTIPTPMNEPAPTTNPNERLLIIASHLSVLFGAGLVLPLIVYLIQNDRENPIATNAREALNFHISVLLYSLCCVPLVFVLVGVPLLFGIGIATIVFAILATLKTADGSTYRYPLTLRLV